MPHDLEQHIAGLDWSDIATRLDETGFAVIPSLLSAVQCTSLAALYEQEAGFRSRVVMARHGFGKGEYRYFSYPLPQLVSKLRTIAYPHLAPIANKWAETHKQSVRYPLTLEEMTRRCHDAGQTRPTPLLLRYQAEDYNCLHQDLYGEHLFPLQLAVLLNEPGLDFEGGEFILTEQRPRMQSRASVVPLTRGDAVVFAVNDRPRQGTRGSYRVKMRHGVSTIRSGQRHALGIIFHDAA